LIERGKREKGGGGRRGEERRKGGKESRREERRIESGGEWSGQRVSRREQCDREKGDQRRWGRYKYLNSLGTKSEGIIRIPGNKEIIEKAKAELDEGKEEGRRGKREERRGKREEGRGKREEGGEVY
jgi:hypothetical protein